MAIPANDDDNEELLIPYKDAALRDDNAKTIAELFLQDGLESLEVNDNSPTVRTKTNHL